MTLDPVAKLWLNRIGTVLGLAGLLFVAFRLKDAFGQIDLGAMGGGGYAALGGLAIVYGASNTLLALGWWRLLRYLDIQPELNWTVSAYAISQLVKYVPGNIFQFAGRQAIGVSAGIGNKPLAKSTALELAFLVSGGALHVPLAVTLIRGGWFGMEAGVMVFAIFVLLALLAAWRLGGTNLGLAALCYLCFLVLSGLVFVAGYEIAGGSGSAAIFPAIAGAYVVAWLAGLVTPGAPAGLGVREAVLLFLLGGLSTPPVILLAVVMGRFVTVLGDLAFYIVGTAMRPPRKALG